MQLLGDSFLQLKIPPVSQPVQNTAVTLVLPSANCGVRSALLVCTYRVRKPPENHCICSDVKYSPAVPSVVKRVEVSSTYLQMGRSQNLDVAKQRVKLEFSPKYVVGVIGKVRMQLQQYGW